MKMTWRALAFALALLASSVALAADAVSISADSVLARTQKKDTSMVILDVRTPEEFAHGHVPGAINIPYDKLNNHADELLSAKNKDVVLYCHSGARAAIAAQTLKAQGFDKLLHLEGDMVKWARENRPTEK
jgi:phage shock protein E